MQSAQRVSAGEHPPPRALPGAEAGFEARGQGPGCGLRDRWPPAGDCHLQVGTLGELEA